MGVSPARWSQAGETPAPPKRRPSRNTGLTAAIPLKGNPVPTWIVVVNYNGLEDTRRCLRSLAELVPAPSVVLVDNASEVDPTILSIFYPIDGS